VLAVIVTAHDYQPRPGIGVQNCSQQIKSLNAQLGERETVITSAIGVVCDKRLGLFPLGCLMHFLAEKTEILSHGRPQVCVVVDYQQSWHSGWIQCTMWAKLPQQLESPASRPIALRFVPIGTSQKIASPGS
jgi:hypothetical protein